MHRMTGLLVGGWRAAYKDLIAAMDAVMDPRLPAWKLVLPPLAGLLAAWFVYVPIHELLHVAGCVATGCTVSELRIAPAYGGSLLERLIPFVVASDEYAGRLSGFDTRDSDLRYLATDLAPYLLTVLIGVPLLRWVASGAARRMAARRWAFGPAVVLAAAPFVSLTGDYFEMGTIVTTIPLGAALRSLRSDDLIKLLQELAEGKAGASGAAAAGVVTVSLLLAGLMAGWTYGLGGAVDSFMARRSSSFPLSSRY